MNRVIPFITIFSRHGKVPSGKNKGTPCPHGTTRVKNPDGSIVIKEADESYLDCKCRKHLRWTDPDTKKQVKISARTRSKTEAAKVKEALERKWRGDPDPAPSPRPGGITVASAITQFTAAKKLKGLRIGSMRNHNAAFAKLLAFCDNPTPLVGGDGLEIPLAKVTYLDEITDDHLLSFVQDWGAFWPSIATQSQHRVAYSGFFNYCVARNWLGRKPLLPELPHYDEAPTMPLSDDEVQRLFTAIPVALSSKREESRLAVKNFFLLQLNSGLACTDACILPVDLVIDGVRTGLYWDAEYGTYVVHTHRIKTGKEVCNPIPATIAEEILSAPRPNPKYIFWTGAGDPQTKAHKMRALVRKVFDVAGIDPGKSQMKSHRLRDTFAVRLLIKGVRIDDVARALGDTVEITQKHYAKWVPERQKRHNDIIAATFDEPNQPSPPFSQAAELALLARLKEKYESSPNKPGGSFAQTTSQLTNPPRSLSSGMS